MKFVACSLESCNIRNGFTRNNNPVNLDTTTTFSRSTEHIGYDGAFYIIEFQLTDGTKVTWTYESENLRNIDYKDLLNKALGRESK